MVLSYFIIGLIFIIVYFMVLYAVFCLEYEPPDVRCYCYNECMYTFGRTTHKLTGECMNKFTELLNKVSNHLVLLNDKLKAVYGNETFLIDGIPFYKPQYVAFIDKYLYITYYITLRRCNTCHTIMKYSNDMSLCDVLYNYDVYNQYLYTDLDYILLKNISIDADYKSNPVITKPAILFCYIYNMAYPYYCDNGNSNCILCDNKSINLCNNVFGDIQDYSDYPYIFLYNPTLNMFCTINDTLLTDYCNTYIGNTH